MAICFDRCLKLPYDARTTCSRCGKCPHLCKGKHPGDVMVNEQRLGKIYQDINSKVERERLVDRSIPGRK